MERDESNVMQVSIRFHYGAPVSLGSFMHRFGSESLDQAHHARLLLVCLYITYGYLQHVRLYLRAVLVLPRNLQVVREASTFSYLCDSRAFIT